MPRLKSLLMIKAKTELPSGPHFLAQFVKNVIMRDDPSEKPDSSGSSESWEAVCIALSEV